MIFVYFLIKLCTFPVVFVGFFRYLAAKSGSATLNRIHFSPQDDDLSDSSVDRFSQRGRKRQQRRVESFPTSPVTDQDRTLNEKLSLNITISLGDKLSKITISPLGKFLLILHCDT